MSRLYGKNRNFGKNGLLILTVCIFLFGGLLVFPPIAQSENEDKQAQTVSAYAGTATADSARDIVIRQLTAIKDRDAEQAFLLTTGALHEKFDNPKKFLGKIRFDYHMIYNHQNYKFIGSHELPGNRIIQKVKVEDNNGNPAIVIFRLEKQDNELWLIDSFSVLELSGQPI